MLYQAYEFIHAALTPARLMAEVTRTSLQHPMNPMAFTPMGRTLAANAEMFERMTKKFGQPAFGLLETTIGGKSVKVTEERIITKPFCHLLHFKRHTNRKDPKVLLVAPMSGHYSTLLRGTVEALLPHHDVYITEWIDARQVPLSAGRFNLDDYVDYLIEFMRHFEGDVNLIAVCQPAVPVMAAVSLLATWKDKAQPKSMVLMGGPIDTRISPTVVNDLAKEKPLSWFENSVCMDVPAYYPGAYRKVYPGFLQLSGFMSMNMDSHIEKHLNFYQHLVEGDGSSAATHRKFYNEYLAVMDLPAEFFVQTIDIVFKKHLLPKGQMKWKCPRECDLHDVRPQDITKTALLTVEGELDDISADGQTTAAHTLCTGLAANKQFHHYQENVGHYGIFNGRRWRTLIMPRLRTFFREQGKYDPVPIQDLFDGKKLSAPQWNEKTMNVGEVQKWKKEKAAAKAKKEKLAKQAFDKAND